MWQRRRPSWCGTVLLTAGLLAGTGCGGNAAPTEPEQLRSQSRRSEFGPDLVIRALSGPTSVRFGEPLTTTVRVCNEGTARAQSPLGSVQLDLYLSTDDTLSWPDPGLPPPVDQELLTTLNVSELEAGQCETLAFTTSAMPPGSQTDGTYFLGAIIDVQQVLVELDEANNTAVTALGIGDRPDLVIKALRGPRSSQTSGTVASTVEVCNQGTGSSASTAVELYLSTTGTLSPPGAGGPPPTNQALLGTVMVSELSPGHCAIRQSSFPVVLPPDAASGQPLYLGAIVDTPQASAELNEDNNTFVGDLIAVGEGVDLVVTAIHGPPSVQSGEPLSASVRVCNHGTLPAGATPVELYLSVDGNVSVPGNGPLPPGQALVGQTFAPFLNPGDCLTRHIQGVATLPAGAPQDGAVFLAAIADPADDIPELREDNNVFVQGLIGVGQRPDLVVTALHAPPSAASWPSATPVSVTVCNEGTVSSPMVAIELYLSMVPTLDSNPMGTPFHGTQTLVGDITFPGPDAGRCVTREVPILVNRPPGAPPQLEAFYLGAIVDPWSNVEELREDNNVFVGERMGVGDKPDLVITSVKGPASHSTGSFPVTARVCNQGSLSSPYTQLEFYLAAHGFLNAPAQGGAPNSTDPHTALLVGIRDVPPLQPDECRTLSASAESWGVPVEYVDRAFHLGAIIDPASAVVELREDNNTFVGDSMGLGLRPDLVVTAIQAPASVDNSAPFTASLTVCNQGTADSQPAMAQVYLSTEPHLEMPDWHGMGGPLPWSQMPVASLNIPSLHVGRCVTEQVNGTAYPPSGAHGESLYLGASVDVDDVVQELREDNNSFVHGRIGVGDGADLVVTAISAPASVSPHSTFTATVTVCNQGTAYSSQTDLELYFSTQARLELPRWNGPGFPFPETQAPIGYMPVQSLSPGQCITQSFQGDASPPPVAQAGQPLYLGAIVDPWNGIEELREDNNTFVSGRMGVGNGPDLVITALQAPPNVAPDAAFHPTVTVCNQGTNPSSSTLVEFYLSTEEVVVLPRWTGPGSPLPPTQHTIGELNIPPLNSGKCFAGSAFAMVAPPPAASPGQQLYLGAIVDGGQSQQELREDNNVFMSGRLVVGHAPDLVVTSLTGPASVGAYSPFTATATVCNQGTMESSPTHLEVYLATEARMVMPPWYAPGMPTSDSQIFAGSQPVPSLEVGDCITVSVSAWADVPSAAQPNQPLYLGAHVNPTVPSGELRDDNNTFVGGLMGVGNGPDLVITALQAPVSVAPYEDFTATVTVCNQGTQISSNTQVELYFSTQAQVVLPRWNGPGPLYPGTQELIGSWSVQSLNPGQCVTEPVPAWASLPPEALSQQPLYLGAAVDAYPMQSELREDNNTFVSGLMGVGHLPDLVVTSVSGPTSVSPGSTFTATVRVCNQGTTSTSGATNVELYLSSSDSLEFPYQSGPGSPPEDQMPIGSVTVQHLAPGECITRNTLVSASTPPSAGPIGFFYLGAIADPWKGVEELREDNNVFADRLILVTP